MPGVFKIKNLQDAEFTLTHPDGAGAISIDSNKIANIDTVNAALALKANTADTFGTSLLQTYNDTATKAFGVTYTNNTGRSKHITVIQGPTTSTMTLTIDGVICDTDSISPSDYSAYTSVQGIVPNGKTYIVSISGASGGVYRWIESY